MLVRVIGKHHGVHIVFDEIVEPLVIRHIVQSRTLCNLAAVIQQRHIFVAHRHQLRAGIVDQLVDHCDPASGAEYADLYLIHSKPPIEKFRSRRQTSARELVLSLLYHIFGTLSRDFARKDMEKCTDSREVACAGVIPQFCTPKSCRRGTARAFVHRLPGAWRAIPGSGSRDTARCGNRRTG